MRTSSTLCSVALLCAMAAAPARAADSYLLPGLRSTPLATPGFADSAIGLRASWGFELTPNPLTTGLQMAALGFFSLTNDVSVFGKAGVSMGNANGLVPALGFKLARWDERANMGYGIGLHYQLSESWALRTEFDRSLTDINLLSFGVQTRF